MPATSFLIPTRIDVAAGARERLVPLLNASLADMIDLFNQTKHAHWNVKGPAFIALHELFDDVAERVEEHCDLLAERVVALGGTPRGRRASRRLRRASPSTICRRSRASATSRRCRGRSPASPRPCAARSSSPRSSGIRRASDLFTEISRALDKDLLVPGSAPAGALTRVSAAHSSPLLPALLLALTAATGLIDAVSYLALGHVFTANMTGNVVFLGFAAAGAPGLSIDPLARGARGVPDRGGAGGRLASPPQRGPAARSAPVRSFSAEAVLLCGRRAGGVRAGERAFRPSQGPLYLVIVFTGLALGLRNATVRKLGRARPHDDRAHADAHGARGRLAARRRQRRGLRTTARGGRGHARRRGARRSAAAGLGGRDAARACACVSGGCAVAARLWSTEP